MFVLLAFSPHGPCPTRKQYSVEAPRIKGKNLLLSKFNMLETAFKSQKPSKDKSLP